MPIQSQIIEERKKKKKANAKQRNKMREALKSAKGPRATALKKGIQDSLFKEVINAQDGEKFLYDLMTHDNKKTSKKTH